VSAPDRPNAGAVHLTIEAGRSVATITVDRPGKLNALTLEMLYQLDEALDHVEASDARVVVLRTAGDKVFCVGADIAAFAGLGPVEMWRSWIARGHRSFDRLARLRQPTVAVIDGLAVGGGLELALSCDLRVASTAARCGLPEVGLGTIPGWGGTHRLTALVGAARAKELILTGRRIPAEKALAWGLYTEVVEPDDLERAVQALLDELLGVAPVAQQVAKQLVDAAAAGAPPAVTEALASGLTAATADFEHGISGFVSKQPAHFEGR